jgi:hypothetical protein
MRSRHSFRSKPMPACRPGAGNDPGSLKRHRREQQNAEGSEESTLFSLHASTIFVLPSAGQQEALPRAGAQPFDGFRLGDYGRRWWGYLRVCWFPCVPVRQPRHLPLTPFGDETCGSSTTHGGSHAWLQLVHIPSTQIA